MLPSAHRSTCGSRNTYNHTHSDSSSILLIKRYICRLLQSYDIYHRQHCFPKLLSSLLDSLRLKCRQHHISPHLPVSQVFHSWCNQDLSQTYVHYINICSKTQVVVIGNNITLCLSHRFPILKSFKNMVIYIIGA